MDTLKINPISLRFIIILKKLRGETKKMNKENAIKEKEELLKKLEVETNESVRYNIERRIGDLNQFVINK